MVTAVPDAKRGEIVTAYVVPKEDTLTAAQLDAYCKQSPLLANYKRPRLYRFVETLPRNATGKKLHCVMKQLAQADAEKELLIRA